MTVGQMEERLLGYASSLRNPSDLSASRFAATLEVPLAPSEPDGEVVQAKSQPLANGFSFSAYSWPEQDGFEFNEARFYMPGPKSPAQDADAPCLWDAEEASLKLDALGYKRGGQTDFQQGWLRQHWRSVEDGTKGIDASLLIYRTRVGQECVYGIRFRGGDA
ncbi:MAG: hypothetical protein ACOH1V_04120 [Stenotrophomonas sp.]